MMYLYKTLNKLNFRKYLGGFPLKTPWAYMSKRVLGVGAYSRGGGVAYSRVIYSSQFKSGFFFQGISEQIKDIYL